MTVRQQWMIVLGAIVLLASGVFTASRLMRDDLQPIAIGGRAPNFSAVTVDRTPKLTTLDAYKGQVVLLNVWGTYCIPCRSEMPSIEALYQQLKAKGLRVVAISIDPPGKEQDIRDFAKEFGLSFDILYDTAGAMEQQYRITGVPESFVIARDGTVHKHWIGEDNWNSDGNRKLIEQLLAEPK
jgi:cytochrome c biogenesis protein CcmG/thiol:disulfide interchange protein DsbE